MLFFALQSQCKVKNDIYRNTMMTDFRCDIYPEETFSPKSEGSAGFAVTINGSPLEYRPEQHYKITLQAGYDMNHLPGFDLEP